MNTYKTTIQVRFGHVDPAGIVYFPRIYDYLHDVFEEMWEEHVGERYYYMLCEQHIGFPLVHADVDFKHPLHFGDRPTAEVTCFKLGRSSLGLRYRILLDGVECVHARMTTVCVDLSEESMKNLTIPDRFRERFEIILEPAS